MIIITFVTKGSLIRQAMRCKNNSSYGCPKRASRSDTESGEEGKCRDPIAETGGLHVDVHGRRLQKESRGFAGEAEDFVGRGDENS